METLNSIIINTFYKDYGRPEVAKTWDAKEYNVWLNKLNTISFHLGMNNYILAIQELSAGKVLN